MSKNNIISVFCFGEEIGKIGHDEDRKKSFFQYNPAFLKSGKYKNLFPLLIKRTEQVQVFGKFNNEAFRGLPPMIADSLPDLFGNIIFKTWLESKQKNFEKISILEQLAYVSNRGMGALEYKPGKAIPKNTSINIEAITDVLKKVLENKMETIGGRLETSALLNVFKIGTSAGGARPKILVSEHKESEKIIPGDLEFSEDYNHYLVKLHIDDDAGYNREIIEYCYYLTAVETNITMMPSKLIDEKHFATLRYDRIEGHKKHILTASGMTGWDYNDPEMSSYENLFDLAIFLKLPYKEIDELFRRMIFNLVFANMDDHLKNHSFIYDEENDKWNLAPAYDLTYSLNPLINFKRSARALSINGKRIDITLDDVLKIADKFTIKNPKGIITQVQNNIPTWEENAKKLQIPERIINTIQKDFRKLV